MAERGVSITYADMVKRILNDETMKLLRFTFWRHLSFGDILGYAGVQFIDGNSYEIDRVFITGEFLTKEGKKIISTFALGIDEIIVIIDETLELKWKLISP
jgi:hypothetical protein